MKNDKKGNNVVKKYNSTLSELKKAAERRELADTEKGLENKGKKR